jgi:speckle-type POZ protein
VTNLPDCPLNCQVFLDYDNVTPEQRKGQKKVLDNMENLFNSQMMTDIVFIVRWQKIRAHLAVCVAGSSVFSSMFQNRKFLEAETKTVHIEDIEPTVFKELLRYLYTGTVNADVTKEGLFLASVKYQIDTLKRQCEEHLMGDLDVENVVRRLMLARSHSSSDLLEAAIQFIARNKQVVCHRVEWKELIKTNPALFFHVTQKLLIG